MSKISLQKKKKELFENKLTDCVSKPKDLWKAFTSLDLPDKSRGCIVGALTENQIVKDDTKSAFKIFKFFFQTCEKIYWQNFPNHKINIKLILSTIIIEKLKYLKSCRN